jgi:hypothetical protein
MNGKSMNGKPMNDKPVNDKPVNDKPVNDKPQEVQLILQACNRLLLMILLSLIQPCPVHYG